MDHKLEQKTDDEMRSMATKQAATPADHQNPGSCIPIRSRGGQYAITHVDRENYYYAHPLRSLTARASSCRRCLSLRPFLLFSYYDLLGVSGRTRNKRHPNFPIAGVDRIDRRLLGF
jgi:hypothetical protein